MQKYDELNNLTTKRRSLPLEQFFGEMELTEKQTSERLLFSLRFRDMLLVAFSFIELGNIERAEQYITQHYMDIANEFYNVDFKFEGYIRNLAKEITNTTVKHIEDGYYTSEDRATLIAENEANTTLNRADLLRAKDNGATMKTWVSMRDIGVRQTHREVDNKTIPIDEYFLVGMSLMRYPKDYDGINVTGEETVNCRCTIEYF